MSAGEAAVAVFVANCPHKGALTPPRRSAAALHTNSIQPRPRPLASPASVSQVVLSVRTCLSHLGVGANRVSLECVA